MTTTAGAGLQELAIRKSSVPALKHRLAGVVEWRIRSLSATFEPINTSGEGMLVLLCAPSSDFKPTSIGDAMVKGGAMKNWTKRFSTKPSVPSINWVKSDNVGGFVYAYADATPSKTIGYLKVSMTVQTRGLA